MSELLSGLVFIVNAIMIVISWATGDIDKAIFYMLLTIFFEMLNIKKEVE